MLTEFGETAIWEDAFYLRAGVWKAWDPVAAHLCSCRSHDAECGAKWRGLGVPNRTCKVPLPLPRALL